MIFDIATSLSHIYSSLVLNYVVIKFLLTFVTRICQAVILRNAWISMYIMFNSREPWTLFVLVQSIIPYNLSKCCLMLINLYCACTYCTTYSYCKHLGSSREYLAYRSGRQSWDQNIRFRLFAIMNFVFKKVWRQYEINFSPKNVIKICPSPFYSSRYHS